MSAAGMRALVHELDVHQIELEMRNEELRRTQAAAQEAADNYKGLFGFAPAAYFVLDGRGVVREVNLAGAALLGLERDRVTHQVFAQFVAPDSRARFARFRQSMQQTGGRHTCELRLLKRDGRRDALVEGAVVPDGGRGERLWLTVSDITERKRAEQTIRLQADRFATLLATVSDGFWTIDAGGRLLEVNDAYCRMSGYSRKELLRRRISDIEAVVTPGHIAEHRRRVVAHGFDRFECRHRRKDGSLFDVEISMSHWKTADQFFLFVRDVTKDRQAEAALQDSELKFRSVVESAQDAIVTADHEGRIVFVNRSAEKMFRFTRGELQGRLYTCLIPKPRRAASLRRLQRLVAGAEPALLQQVTEASALRSDGTVFPVELTLANWRSRAGAFFTGIVRDITDRKRAEQTLRESKEHYFQLFRQARQMEEDLRQLSRKVLSVQEEERKRISRELHDEIGQALLAIDVGLAMLRKRAGRDRMLQKKLETAQHMVEQGMASVRRFARELRPDLLDHLGTCAAFRSYVNGFAARTRIKATLRTHPALDRLDSQQGLVLYRVAQESLTNVYKHARASRVDIEFKRVPHGIWMEIRDNGRAFRVGELLNGHRKRRLGLLGMQERVRLVDGQFAVSSEPGRGTTIRVKIPYPASRQPAESPANHDGAEADASQRRPTRAP